MELSRYHQGASIGRRAVALSLDWFACALISRLITTDRQLGGWVTLAIFFSECALFTTLLGGSAGQVLIGIRIVDFDSEEKIGALRSLIRSALICLVVPPILTVAGRGLHDRAVGSKAVVSV